jgi:hypothetical protein
MIKVVVVATVSELRDYMLEPSLKAADTVAVGDSFGITAARHDNSKAKKARTDSYKTVCS